MEARFPHDLHVARTGEVRDRNVLGYKGNGPVLGYVRRSGSKVGWTASRPDGKALPDTFRTRRDALWGLMEEYVEGRLP